jgi:site-specific recombinase XerD
VKSTSPAAELDENEPMSEILERYLADLQKKKRKPAKASINAAQADLRSFIVWWETRGIPFEIELVIEEDLLGWQEYRQEVDQVKNTTINRANASLRGFFTWAHTARIISHNPAEDLEDLPEEDIPPRSLPPEAVDWLLRFASAQEDQITRPRDRALITLLSDCGLRSHEAADVQLRDLDLRGRISRFGPAKVANCGACFCRTVPSPTPDPQCLGSVGRFDERSSLPILVATLDDPDTLLVP